MELNQIHHQLDELFFQHQTELLKGDYLRAKALLKTFEEALLNHMKEEEEILLPLYRERAANIRGGNSDLFNAEHKKILEWLNRIKLRAHRLQKFPDLRTVISLLDDEAHFKKYIEHHTLREDRIFYPEVDRVTTPQEKIALARLLTFSLDPPSDPKCP